MPLSAEVRQKISNSLKGHRVSPLTILRCHSPEANEKRRKAMSGVSNPNFGKRGIECSWFGKPLTVEHRAKISSALKGKEKSEEHKAKCRVANLGKHHPISEETKLKIAQTLKGHPVSDETRRMIAENTPKRIGAKNNLWKGGIANSPYSSLFTKQLRELIRMRDDYKCRLCRVPQIECLSILDVHHIDYDKQNCLPENLISLCRSCHLKTNHNRDYWLNFFSEVKNAS